MIKLGQYTELVIGTQQLEVSSNFYKKLGFQAVKSDTTQVQMADSSLLITLLKTDATFLRLRYYESDYQSHSQVIQQLQDLNLEIIKADSTTKEMDGTIFQTDYQVQIQIMQVEPDKITQQKRTTLLDYMPDFQNIKQEPNPKIGIFGEMAIPVQNLDAACTFWEKLGFEVNKMKGPYPWAIAQDGLHIIGLHQTQDFQEVALTYFGSKMSEKVRDLRQNGVDSIEIFQGTGGGNENNVVVKSYENQTFFLFNV